MERARRREEEIRLSDGVDKSASGNKRKRSHTGYACHDGMHTTERKKRRLCVCLWGNNNRAGCCACCWAGCQAHTTHNTPHTQHTGTPPTLSLSNTGAHPSSSCASRARRENRGEDALRGTKGGAKVAALLQGCAPICGKNLRLHATLPRGVCGREEDSSPRSCRPRPPSCALERGPRDLGGARSASRHSTLLPPFSSHFSSSENRSTVAKTNTDSSFFRERG